MLPLATEDSPNIQINIEVFDEKVKNIQKLNEGDELDRVLSTKCELFLGRSGWNASNDVT